MEAPILRMVLQQISSERNPLGLLRLITLLPDPGSWDFVITQAPGALTASITPPKPLPLQNLLALQVPEFLYGEEVELETEKGIVIIPGAFQAPASLPAQSISDYELTASKIVIRHFANSQLPAQLQSRLTIENFLRRNTWLGSRKCRRYRCRVRLQVLGTLYEFTPLSVQAGSTSLRFQLELKVPSNGTVTLATDVLLRSFTVRDVHLGESAALVRRIQPCLQELRKLGIRGADIEIDQPGLVTLGLGGKDLLGLSESESNVIGEVLSESPKVAELAHRLYLLRRETEVRDLNSRIVGALTGPQVYVDADVLTAVPRSEMNVVGLFHLLEGRRMLPFYFFKSRAWASSSGLDLIADYQFSGQEPIHLGRPLEFEYRLENFFSHGHAVEQTDGVICWELPPADLAGLSSTADCWRLEYKSGGSSMWVAVVARFPNIHIR